jgi:O-antigen/teichoic acid export membrane protein
MYFISIKQFLSILKGFGDGDIKPLSLRENFSWITVGNTVYAVCQWGIIVILAKFGSPEIVGRFVLALAITAPIIMFSQLKLRIIQATDATWDYNFSDYLGLRLMMTGFAGIVILFISLVLGYYDILIIILLVYIYKSIESVSDVFYGYYQLNERMECIALSKIIKGIIGLILLASLFYVTTQLAYAIIGLIIVFTGTLILYDAHVARRMLRIKHVSDDIPFNLIPVRNFFLNNWNKHKLYVLFRLALPLGFVSMLNSLDANVPRYMVDKYSGEAELGVFGAIVYLMVAGGTLVNSLGQAASPRLAQYYVKNNIEGFKQLLRKLAGFGVLTGSLGVIVASTIGEDILRIIYTDTYAVYKNVFVIIMVAGLINYCSSLLLYGTTAARLFKSQFTLYSIILIITIISGYVLIESYGIEGASWTLIISALVRLLGILILNKIAITKMNNILKLE